MAKVMILSDYTPKGKRILSFIARKSIKEIAFVIFPEIKLM